MSISRGTVGSSVVCDCGISWLNLLILGVSFGADSPYAFCHSSKLICYNYFPV